MKIVKSFIKQLLQEFYKLRWYIQHLIDENEYQYDDGEWANPLSESNWIYITNKHFMKYVIFTLQEMPPEQLKQNPITVHPNQKLDTDEGKSTKDEEPFTTTHELSEDNSTSDIPTEITEESKLQKHLKFIMYSTKQYIMKMIYLKTNL